MSWDVSYTVPESWNHCDNGDMLVNEVHAKALCCECSDCCKGARWVEDVDSVSVGIYDPITLIVDKKYIGTAVPTTATLSS